MNNENTIVFEDILEGALECLLWAGHMEEENGEEGAPLDDIFYLDDFKGDDLESIRSDVLDFTLKNIDLLGSVALNAGQIGHNFILTCQGHGTGFWDRELGDAGDVLSDACEPYHVYASGYKVNGESRLYVHG